MNMRVVLLLGLVFLLTAAWLRFSKSSAPPNSASVSKATSSNEEYQTQSRSAEQLATTQRPEFDGLHPLDPVLKLARAELEALTQTVVDYTAVLRKPCCGG